jgi:hypothetical protein
VARYDILNIGYVTPMTSWHDRDLGQCCGKVAITTLVRQLCMSRFAYDKYHFACVFIFCRYKSLRNSIWAYQKSLLPKQRNGRDSKDGVSEEKRVAGNFGVRLLYGRICSEKATNPLPRLVSGRRRRRRCTAGLGACYRRTPACGLVRSSAAMAASNRAKRSSSWRVRRALSPGARNA